MSVQVKRRQTKQEVNAYHTRKEKGGNFKKTWREHRRPQERGEIQQCNSDCTTKRREHRKRRDTAMQQWLHHEKKRTQKEERYSNATVTAPRKEENTEDLRKEERYSNATVTAPWKEENTEDLRGRVTQGRGERQQQNHNNSMWITSMVSRLFSKMRCCSPTRGSIWSSITCLARLSVRTPASIKDCCKTSGNWLVILIATRHQAIGWSFWSL